MVALTRRAVLAGLSAFGALPAAAQSGWPNRPITMVHGLPPGGSVDGIVRIISEGLSTRLGQSVVVDARPGAGATLAATQVARAAPDGYTLLGIPSGHAVSAAMYRKLAYQPVDDFTYISTVTEYPFVLVTYPEHPIKTFKDLVATGAFAERAAALRRSQWNAAASVGRVVLARRRHPRATGAVSRQSAGGRRPARQAARLHARSAHGASRSDQGRPVARARDDRRDAFLRAADVPTVAEHGIRTTSSAPGRAWSAPRDCRTTSSSG